MGMTLQSIMDKLRLPRIEFERSHAANKEYSPVATYYIIMVPALILIAIGLMMAFSSQAVVNIAQGIDPYKAVLKPALFVAVGLVFIAAAQFVRPHWWKRLSVATFFVSLLGQMLVLSPLGVTVNGNTNWIMIPGSGGSTIQPSEFLKLGVLMFLAWVLSRRGTRLNDPWQILVLTGVPIVIAIGDVMLGHDKGTAAVLTLACLGALWVADLPSKWFKVMSIPLAGLSVLVVMSQGYLIERVLQVLPWTKPERDLAQATQTDHALWAFGSGGLFGVGPGASREKWEYLQEGHTDFILAIIGEEFGFFGSSVILVCIGVILWGMLRLSAHTSDLYIRVLAGGVASWIGFQALVNIGMASALLPVIGVTLPFVSAGGSSMIFTSLALGVVLSLARHEANMRQIGRPDEASAGRDPRVVRPRRSVTSRR